MKSRDEEQADHDALMMQRQIGVPKEVRETMSLEKSGERGFGMGESLTGDSQEHTGTVDHTQWSSLGQIL